MNDELIPCDDELNRLKEFLASVKNQPMHDPNRLEIWIENQCSSGT